MIYLHWAIYLLFVVSLAIIWNIRRKTIRLKKQLNEEIREKQQILSVISHDIKSPFNRISALEQLIALDDNKLSDAQTDFLDKIHQVIADGLGLIRNLVDYRNLEYRKVKVMPEDLELSVIVENAVKRHTSLAGKKHLKFVQGIEENVLVHSDHHLVNRVIDNVLSNAIKFSPPGKRIGVTLLNEEVHARIEVSDEGPGFSRDEVKKLFRKFQKLSIKPTAGESTTGLGLFISRAMLQRIGGTIECRTKEGNGSTFIIRLPRTISARSVPQHHIEQTTGDHNEYSHEYAENQNNSLA